MATFKYITPTERLRADAADSFARAVAYGGLPVEVNDALRDLNEQRALFFANYTTNYAASSKLDRRVYNGRAYYRRAPFQGYVAVAVPGTSKHGDGLAVDLGHNARAWMFKHGDHYGWVNPAWAKKPATFEPWHWEYVPSRDKSRSKNMTGIRHDTRKAHQRMTKGRWNTLKVTEKGGVSVGFGPCLADAEITVHFRAPQGTQVRVRAYKVNYKTGKRVYTYDNESKMDSPVTKGNTMCFHGRFRAELRADERLRFEVYTWEDGVEITSASYRTEEN